MPVVKEKPEVNSSFSSTVTYNPVVDGAINVMFPAMAGAISYTALPARGEISTTPFPEYGEVSTTYPSGQGYES